MEGKDLLSYWGLASASASPPTTNSTDLISDELMRWHWQLNPAASPGIRLLAAGVQEGVTPEGAVPTAMLRGVVEAEGSVGQAHPGKDEAGGSSQQCQLGEHGGDESLWAAPVENGAGGHQMSGRLQNVAVPHRWSLVRGQNSPPLHPKRLQPQGAEAEDRAVAGLGCFELGRSGQGAAVRSPVGQSA